MVAKITLYLVISGSLTALAFVRSNEDCGGDLNDAFFKLPFVSRARAMVDGVGRGRIAMFGRSLDCRRRPLPVGLPRLVRAPHRRIPRVHTRH